MSLRPWLLAFALLGLSAPAQEDESRVYFSLTTDKPVRAGEAAQVRVQAQGLRQLEFRLYRVNDPIKFFRQLDDAHQFSGIARRPAKARTPIEKFAAWKRNVHTRWRDLARRQFSAENRHAIRAALSGETPKTKQPPAPNKGTEFAGVPILNPQQLVRSWTQPIQTPRKWEAATVPVAVQDKGLYVLEATDGKKQAYTILSVTDLVLITKTSPGRLMVRAVDRTSGAPLAECPVQVYDPMHQEGCCTGQDRREWAARSAGQTGCLRRGPRPFGAARRGFRGHHCRRIQPVREGRRSLTGYVYTDRPVYRPGHNVNYKSILRTVSGADYKLPDQSSVHGRDRRS